MLTSRSFSCPSRRRYLKFGSVPQISHVAYICTEIPPRSIGCFEMDVNMNLLVIYLRPFGCLYSVAALKGHGRVFNLSWSAVIVWRSVVPHGLCVRKWVKDKAIKRFHNNTKCPIKCNTNFEQRRKTQNKCGLKITLIHEHSQTEIS